MDEVVRFLAGVASGCLVGTLLAAITMVYLTGTLSGDGH